MIDSPVLAIIKKHVVFKASSPKPIYIQAAQRFLALFQSNSIASNTKLPGTRIVAKLLQIHRNTAVAIYDELASQGWVVIKPNKGTFVLASNLNYLNKKTYLLITKHIKLIQQVLHFKNHFI